MTQSSNKYDLEERTARFGENVIGFCKSLHQDNISSPLINQVVRSATSIGANYMEANSASSKKEEIRRLWSEAQELTMIFQKITNSLSN